LCRDGIEEEYEDCGAGRRRDRGEKIGERR
jgi:hypothetical protein